MVHSLLGIVVDGAPGDKSRQRLRPTRYIGIIFSVSTVTAILNRSPHPGITESDIMWVVVAILLGVVAPLVLRIPEQLDWRPPRRLNPSRTGVFGSV